jgi:ubiquinone/menaquinone biosynthesis C-methylase UbiE/DNA-binding transcriptional ArsR family regulator
MSKQLPTVQLLSGLKAAGESTRLRLLALLAGGELNVKDLTRILGQSQPRISRHLKLLTEAGLIERFREGSWVFFRLAGSAGSGELARAIVNSLDTSDPDLERDRARAEAVMRERAETAQAYFKEHASEWDVIRSLHVAEDEVEQAMLDAIGTGSFDYFVDLGTGTGRMLELFASRAKRAVGVDINRDMLAYARAKLEAASLSHCQVRQGDLFSLSFADGEVDVVVLHQVLHFLDDPLGALKEAARILGPGGKMLVVDFAPHELEFLRENHAHRRLGLEPGQVADWIASSGMKLGLHTDLKPRGSGEAGKLTVSLWLAQKPGDLRKRNRSRSARKLEATH